MNKLIKSLALLAVLSLGGNSIVLKKGQSNQTGQKQQRKLRWAAYAW